MIFPKSTLYRVDFFFYVRKFRLRLYSVVMLLLILYLFALTAAAGLAVTAGWSDYKGMIIPNFIPLLAVAAFGLAFTAAYFAEAAVFQSLKAHLIAGGIVFIVTFILFAMGMIGGGDAKLVSAYAFWVGFTGMPVFLFYTALGGAVTGLAALYLKRKKPFDTPVEGSWVARVQAGESVVPYGIPIALGAWAAFVVLGYAAPEKLSLFLMSK